MKKRLLVTGGAGFIGSHMVDLLLSKGYFVRVVDDLSSGYLQNIKHHKKNKRFQFIKLNLFKLKNNSFLKNIDTVFHFAGKSSVVPSFKNPQTYYDNNFILTVKLLKLCKDYNVKKFIYAASASCYGNSKLKSIKEDSSISLNSPYASSKYFGEQAVLHWNKVYKLQSTSLRLFNVYGNRSSDSNGYSSVISTFLRQKLKKKPLTIIGSGTQTRDFIHVSDVAEAFYSSFKNKSSGNIFNVGSGKSITILKLSKYISNKIVHISERPGQVLKSKANIFKIRRLLKWQPKININDGIKELIKIDLKNERHN